MAPSDRNVDRVLEFTGKLALLGLAVIYAQAGLIQGDLLSNPNWTISFVMVYSYNLPVTYAVLFPAFITICVFYALKLDSVRVRSGSAVAIAGGIGLIAHPVTTHELEHVVFALVVFASSGFWYPECSVRQFRNFACSSVLFFGGFLGDVALNGGGGVIGADAGRRTLMTFVPSACCAAGELGIFVTWGQMVQLRGKGRLARDK